MQAAVAGTRRTMTQKRYLDLRKATKDEPQETLGKKLVKEQEKRRAAEKEVGRLKEQIKFLENMCKELQTEINFMSLES